MNSQPAFARLPGWGLAAACRTACLAMVAARPYKIPETTTTATTASEMTMDITAATP